MDEIAHVTLSPIQHVFDLSNAIVSDHMKKIPAIKQCIITYWK